MNPYRKVHDRIRRAQPRSFDWVLPVIAALATAFLARPVLLQFLDRGDIAAGIEGISLRLGLVVAGAMAMHTYSALVRGPDRAVLDVHPVQPRQLLWALVVRTGRERLYLPVMGALVLLPVAVEGHVVAWAGGAGVVVGAWVAALGIGFAVHLSAVWVAWSPKWASVLEAVRGDTPAMQAALIYAPGVALAVVGLACGFAAAGVNSALQGLPLAWSTLLVLPALGAVGLFAALPLCERYYVRATALLGEIEAAWEGVAEHDEDEARHVYLEWVPPSTREIHRARRHGWRRLRSWATGAWLLGVAGAIAGWSGEAGAVDRAAVVVGAAALLIVALPTRMPEGDPQWLGDSLGVQGSSVAAARAWVAWLYAQGAILPPMLSVGVRHGLDALIPFLAVELVAGAAAGIAASAAWRFGARSSWLYGPMGLLVWAAVFGRVFA